MVDLSLKMGKTPVVVKDRPGFLVNRILLPYILEAVQMVDEQKKAVDMLIQDWEQAQKKSQIRLVLN